MVLASDRYRRARRARRRRRKRAIAATRAVAAALVLMQQRIRRPCRQPMTMTWTLMLKDLTPDEFTDRYRLTIEQFYSLLQRILAKRPKYRGRAGALDCRLKLASCLRYLAGGKARDVADLHGQRESIFYKHLDETIDAILATEWSTMRLPVYPWQRQQCPSSYHSRSHSPVAFLHELLDSLSNLEL